MQQIEPRLHIVFLPNVKAHWRSLYEAGKMKEIRDGDWATKTDALANPGNPFFLETEAECNRCVNTKKDNTGQNWAKKSM